MSELKACPFCGSGAAYTQILGNYKRSHEVYCSTCDGAITEGRSKDGVIHNWNNRPIEDALTARIAELESLVEQLIWVGNDLLVSNTNPVTITLFNGLVCNAKERER